ncbi:uncharacterized protein LOC134656443 [Cydia amplana]|uniref:uncharacterized protein LOC134656443 n=1 Tax=Cydia amplana TaxID=1869771 RepID=UPI002FE62BD1
MAKRYQDEFQPRSNETLRLEAKILLCESPSLIYISLVHQQKTFHELFEDIQKFYSKRKTPRRERWKENDRCCAFCMQSQTWRRATILKTKKDQVTVFFTDFAQTETVSISNLKKLHTDFEVIGDAAIKCHLAGLLPADGEWPSLTKEFLKDKLEEYKRVFVTKVGEFEDKSMPIQLWVYHTELGSALEPNESEWRCLNAELASRGLAIDTRQVRRETMPIQLWVYHTELGSALEPNESEWRCLNAELASRGLAIDTRQVRRETMPIQLWVYHTELGSALEPNESEWRCLNAELASRGLAIDTRQVRRETMPIQLWVYHTELGSALEPNESEWRCLNAELASRGLAIDTRQVRRETMPIQLWVYHTKLGSALEPNESEWRCLNAELASRGLAIDTRQVRRETMPIQLWVYHTELGSALEPNESEWRCLNAELASRGLAIDTRQVRRETMPIQLWVYHTELGSALEPNESEWRCLNAELASRGLAIDTRQVRRETMPIQLWVYHTELGSALEPNESEWRCLNAELASRGLAIDTRQVRRETMPIQLWVYHTELGSALEPNESEWRCLNAELASRGLAIDTRQVRRETMPIQLWVYHTELGSALEPNESEWRCLNAELASRGLAIDTRQVRRETMPIQLWVYHTELGSALEPNESEWRCLNAELASRGLAIDTRQVRRETMPIQLWVYHTELGSALEPNESEWRCLNAELASRGLAIDTRQIEGATSGDDELCFLNLRGSVKEWLLPPLAGSTGSDDGAEWLPAEPLQAQEFTALPTYIDNDGIIYLHDVSQDDDLEFIRDTLEMAFKEEDPKAPYCSWRVGELCVARYYLDSKFYRGTVLEVNPEQANCLVQYVDYGNSELCAFTDLRKRVALHQIPIQSHKVSLARIKPVGEQWDQTVLDYIHKAIVEKKCFVKVAAPPVNDVTPVDLKYDKLWINDHLVEFDLAEYIDGSKPIERKFKKKSKHASSTTEKNKRTETETNVIEINNGSEPDYIVEEDINSSQASGSPDSFKMSTLVDQNGSASEKNNSNLVSYLRHEDREFSCSIPVINDTNSLELMIVQDAEIHVIYEALLDIVKEVGKNMPPLDGIYEYKPCIALFEDHWYRASILKYSEAKNLVKVHYVDYGNIGIVPLSDVREISKDWVCLPPACVTARLHGVHVNPDFDPDDVTKVYIDTFLDKGPFRVTIVDYVDYDNSVPLVELRNTDGELVYKKLIDEKVLLHNTRDCPASEQNLAI